MGNQKQDSVPTSAAASMPPTPMETDALEVPEIELMTERKKLQVRYDTRSTINSKKKLYLNPWTTQEARALFGAELGRVIPGTDLKAGKIYLILTRADDSRGKELSYNESGNTATVSLADVLLKIQLLIPTGRVAKVPTEVKMIKAMVDGEQVDVPAIVLDIKNRQFEVRSATAKKDDGESVKQTEAQVSNEPSHAATQQADEE